MTAPAPLQVNATRENPGGLPMVRAAAYDRVVAASLERVWENVHDWEHLPWLHGGSFEAITLEASAPWGWRARLITKGGGESVVELVTDKPNDRYVSRTLEGPLAGMEIWTDLTILDPRNTRVQVAFDVPHLPPDKAEQVGALLVATYTTLWNEDEAMMVARQNALDDRTMAADGPVVLGTLDDVMARVPFVADYGGETFFVAAPDGDLTLFEARCPHMLRPLGDVAVCDDGCITCPWHGYRFDTQTGRSADGRRLRLKQRGDLIHVRDGMALLGCLSAS